MADRYRASICALLRLTSSFDGNRSGFSRLREEAQQHVSRQVLSRAVCTLQNLPKIPVARPIMERVTSVRLVTDRCPLRILSSGHDLYGLRDFSGTRRKRCHDRQDLVWMDAPHPREPQLTGGPVRSRCDGLEIIEFGDDTVRWHLGAAVTGCGNGQLGSHYQRMGELALSAHAARRDRAPVGRDEVHQPERQGLDPRVSRNRLDITQRAVGLDQCVHRNVAPRAMHPDLATFSLR